MPLWYVVRDGELWSWTYAKSQKVRNLERDPRCTLQVETGDEYDELRGVMFKAESCSTATRTRRSSRRRDLRALPGGSPRRRADGDAPPGGQARRPAVRAERRRATWDHRKLGGDLLDG